MRCCYQYSTFLLNFAFNERRKSFNAVFFFQDLQTTTFSKAIKYFWKLWTSLVFRFVSFPKLQLFKFLNTFNYALAFHCLWSGVYTEISWIFVSKWSLFQMSCHIYSATSGNIRYWRHLQWRTSARFVHYQFFLHRLRRNSQCWSTSVTRISDMHSLT